MTAVAAPARTAAEVARLLDLPPPTAEQAAVVEAPLAPQLVVAGAGSGKTETMASRVVWLVANGLVAPDAVLGLTFTRKAAGELSERLTRRLRTLARVRPREREQADPVAPDALPRVATYNAYAASLVADHGLRLGLEPGARLLGEAATWQLAHEVVESWDATALEEVDYALDTLVGAVLALAGQCAEHLRDPADLAGLVDAVEARLGSLPKDDKGGAAVAPGSSTDLGRVLRSLRTRRALVPLLQAYAARKRDLGVLDFGDQVALAARLARVPEVAAAERAQYAVVLLDEYQDTSHAQLALLSSLFADGHAVTAVGDPHQSIYGWRGASAGNLTAFRDTFRDGAGAPARVDGLSTSWRNPQVVLDLANAVSAPLAAAAHGVPVQPLRPRADAPVGAVRVAWHDTTDDEVADLADRLREVWSGPGATTVAVLCRQRAQFPAIEKALRDRGVPVEVVGLGGLLHRPEVADVVATLRVLHDPLRGDALVRLLTGPRWRLGPRDLVALGAWARRLARPDDEPRASARDAGEGDQPVHDPDVVDESSVVEALDALPPTGWTSPAGHAFSPAARERLQHLAAELRRLRGAVDLSLPELVVEVERALLLDVELAAGGAPGAPAARAQLDAFADVAARFHDSSERPSLGAFLAWLRAAETRERGLEQADTTDVTGHDDDAASVLDEVQVNPNAVQVLTVHAAKGLEWDVVAVPGLVEEKFPAGRTSKGQDSASGWLTPIGTLPYELRGDAGALPTFPWRSVAHLKAAQAAVAEHKLACGSHEVEEERRLAYVAVTRARARLLLSGASWGTRQKPLRPSRFLVEAVAALTGDPRAELVGCTPERLDDVPEGPNPLQAVQPVAPWPPAPDPDADVLRRAAEAVRAARGAEALGQLALVPADGEVAALADEVDRLLAEREVLRRGATEVVLPEHLSASRAVRLARDPAELALALRRPVPAEPREQARLGTTFHEWVEQHLRSHALLDLDELAGGEADEAAPPQLEALQQAFLESEWASREVLDVEVDLETSVAGTVLRGRIDAVFRDGTGPDGRPRFVVVDWKTGGVPTGDDLRAARVQLAVYRLAWARLHGVPPADVRAAFVHVAAGRTVWLDDEGDQELLEQVLGAVPRERGGG